MILAANLPGILYPLARTACLFSLLFLGACGEQSVLVELSGETMGTRWHVSVATSADKPSEQLTALIQDTLDQVDAGMSTYRPDSDLGRFNRAAPGQWVTISPQTLDVTGIALRVAEQTGNAFNPAVATLVDLWGFGPGELGASVPDEAQIEAALSTTRLDQLELDSTVPALRKLSPMQLDYSAIAKGYGTDQVAVQLERAGLHDFLVEVGGEVRTAGEHPRGRPWRVGIERPQRVQGRAIAALSLADEAVATSGDYRNYREVDGRRYSHTIDPATGYPVSHRLASVTVLAPTAVLADAYATAINVMGPVAGLAFAEKMALPVYLLVKQQEGFEVLYSSAFEPYLQ